MADRVAELAVQIAFVCCAGGDGGGGGGAFHRGQAAAVEGRFECQAGLASAAADTGVADVFGNAAGGLGDAGGPGGFANAFADPVAVCGFVFVEAGLSDRRAGVPVEVAFVQNTAGCGELHGGAHRGGEAGAAPAAGVVWELVDADLAEGGAGGGVVDAFTYLDTGGLLGDGEPCGRGHAVALPVAEVDPVGAELADRRADCAVQSAFVEDAGRRLEELGGASLGVGAGAGEVAISAAVGVDADLAFAGAYGAGCRAVLEEDARRRAPGDRGGGGGGRVAPLAGAGPVVEGGDGLHRVGAGLAVVEADFAVGSAFVEDAFSSLQGGGRAGGGGGADALPVVQRSGVGVGAALSRHLAGVMVESTLAGVDAVGARGDARAHTVADAAAFPVAGDGGVGVDADLA